MSVPLDESPIARPRVTEVEQHGIDTIPAEHRHSTPFDLFRIQFGGANTFATVRSVEPNTSSTGLRP